MLSVAYIVLGIVIFGLCLGVVISLVTLVPLFLYILPYCSWLGVQQSQGNYTGMTVMDDGFTASVKKATRLYKHWITGQELQL